MNINMDILRRGVSKVARKYNLKFAVVFGSAVAGTLRDSSDLDIAVLSEERAPLTYAIFSDIHAALSRQFEKMASPPLDLVDLAKANILFRYEITSKGIFLCGNEDDYATYRAFAFKDYMDSASLRNLEESLIKRRQEFLAHEIHG